MIIYIETKIRFFIDKILNKASRIAQRLNLNKLSQTINKLNKNILLSLYTDNEFLSYVHKKQVGLAKNANSIDTLVLRGSTTDYSFHSPSFPNSYNLGLTSSDLHTCYYLYKNNQTKLPKLKNIILFLGVFVPGYSMQQTSERNRVVAFHHFFNIPFIPQYKIKKRYRAYILDKCHKNKIENTENDYYGYEKKTYYSKDANIAPRVHSHLRENKREPNQLAWLKKLANEVHADDKELIIVLPPFRSDYRSLINDSTTTYKKVYGLNMQHVNFIDLQDSLIFSDDDFGDPDHLNEHGAIKLTKELYRILNS